MIFRRRNRKIIKKEFRFGSGKEGDFDSVMDVVTSECTVLLRCDLGSWIRDGKVVDTGIMRKEMGTLHYLLKTGAKVVIATHVGKPNGVYDKGFSTKPLADFLERQLRAKVYFSEDCIGKHTKNLIKSVNYGSVVVLENLGFYKEEYLCDMTFASQLAEGINLFVNDAFRSAHKSYASVLGVPLFVYSVAGLEMFRNIIAMTKVLSYGRHTKMAVIGGRDVKQKLEMARYLVDKLDFLVVGGCVANTFLLAEGCEIGKSKVDLECVELARKLLEKAKEAGCHVVIPRKFVVLRDEKIEDMGYKEIGTEDAILDVSPEFVLEIEKYIRKMDVVLVAGAIGMCEVAGFEGGTKAILRMLNRMKCFPIVCGREVSKLADEKAFVVCNDRNFRSAMGGSVLSAVEVLRASKMSKLD